jgi:hypothetical protein
LLDYGSDIQLYEEVEIEYDLEFNAAEMIECSLTQQQQEQQIFTTTSKYDSSEIISSSEVLPIISKFNINRNTSSYVFNFKNVTNVNINETHKKIRLIIKECILNHEYNFILMTNFSKNLYFVIDNQNCIINIYVSPSFFL